MAVPIWKDYTATLGSGDYYDYNLRLGSVSGSVIYSGRAYKRPGASSVTTRINDIVADYLRHTIPAMRPAGWEPFEIAVTVVVEVGGVSKATATFYNDWSYDPSFNSGTMPLAYPVKYELDPRQYLLFSTLPTASLTATLYFADGTSSQVVISIARSADFGDDFNADFSTFDAATGGGAAILDLSQFTGLTRVVIGGVTYRVRDNACARYCAYYLNAYGGWDSLLLDGQEAARRGMTHHTVLRDYDNADRAARGWTDFAIEVTPEWTLRTGILSDDESARMTHLLESPDVYLCELATGAVFPVILTDTEDAVQTFAANGRRPNQYAFNARLAQERLRR